LNRLITAIDGLNEWVGRTVSWLTLGLVLLIGVDVLMRYLFKSSQVWVGELEWHLFSLIFILGAGYAFKHDRHVRVDLFYDRFSSKTKAWINLLGTLFFLIPWCVFVMYASSQFAWFSFLIGEGSDQPNGLPARYLIKGAIVLGFFLLLLQGIAFLLRQVQTIFSKNNQNKS